MYDITFSGHIGMWVLKYCNSVSKKQPWLVYKEHCSVAFYWLAHLNVLSRLWVCSAVHSCLHTYRSNVQYTKSRWQGQSVGVFDLCWNMAMINDTFSHKHEKCYQDFIPIQHLSSKVTQRLGCMIPLHSQPHKTCRIVSEILNIETFSHSQLVKLVSGWNIQYITSATRGSRAKQQKKDICSVLCLEHPADPSHIRLCRLPTFTNF